MVLWMFKNNVSTQFTNPRQRHFPTSIHIPMPEQDHLLNGARDYSIAELHTESARSNDIRLDDAPSPRATGDRCSATIKPFFREPPAGDFILPLQPNSNSINRIQRLHEANITRMQVCFPDLRDLICAPNHRIKCRSIHGIFHFLSFYSSCTHYYFVGTIEP